MSMVKMEEAAQTLGQRGHTIVTHGGGVIPNLHLRHTRQRHSDKLLARQMA
jgi:hypothetical protein